MSRSTLAPAKPHPVRRHQLATVYEAADYIGVHHKTVRRWIHQGRLTGYAAGPRLVRVDLDEVDAMLAGQRPRRR